MLLKALITRGAENVLIDLLVDDLWPDTSLDDGKQNFRVVLHRLRKILGHPVRSGSHYIAFERNTVSLNRSLVRLDIDEFLSLCKRARKAEQAGDIKGSIGFGNAAIGLYKGDYLEEELYTPWTMLKREETRALYIDI
jgi:DNA-binding SARP family transcriptional activator